ncbi:DUF4034 domain-containing protein [Actibacterium ureilyticum]|uniref:DUF4034 domain-containing protein n=1 Tax=Actibacterium ureilyticum TaxID=1590614 RepID=UPI001140A2B5|nr:DUF4034 domain-containing protein [Actibacterium ureilyticum]
MRHFLIALFMTLTGIAPVHAGLSQAEKDQVWFALVDGDYTALEDQMRKAHETSLETGEFETVRDYNRLFKTTHPDAGETLERWVEALPDSAYAKTALMWREYHIAWQIRGRKYSSLTHPKSLEGYKRRMEQASELAVAAFALAPDYVPASDAIFSTVAQSRMTGEELLQFVENVMRDTPNYRTIRNAVYPASPKWGGSWELVEMVCDLTRMTDQASYTDCVAQSIIDVSLDHDALTWARQHFADKFRSGDTSGYNHDIVTVYVADVPGFDKTREAELADAILKMARDGGDFHELERAAVNLQLNSQNFPDFAQQVRQVAGEQFLQKFDRDPYNIEYAIMRSGHETKPIWQQHGSRSEAKARNAFPYWKNALKYGERRAAVWGQGAQIVRGMNPDNAYRTAFPFFVNLVAYASDPTTPAMDMFGFYYRTRNKANEILQSSAEGDSRYETALDMAEFAQCPLMRSARLLVESCARQGEYYEGISCQNVPEDLERASSVVEDEALRKACRKEAVMPYEILQYDPLPLTAFGDLLTPSDPTR